MKKEQKDKTLKLSVHLLSSYHIFFKFSFFFNNKSISKGKNAYCSGPVKRVVVIQKTQKMAIYSNP